jgi:hypothetical protein
VVFGAQFRQCRISHDGNRQRRLHAAANAFPQERTAFNDRNNSISFCAVFLISAMLLIGSDDRQQLPPRLLRLRQKWPEALDNSAEYAVD